MRTFLLLLCAAPALAAPLAAHPAPPRVRSGSARADGTLLFGNAEQRVVGARGGVARADSTLEVDASLQVLYGDAAAEDRPREVTKRLWLGALSADWRPYAPWSPFALATYESNLEKRIASRVAWGVGAKRTFVRSARTEASLSVALLDERTGARPDRDAAAAPPRVVRVTRWSARARVQHGLDRRLRLSHTTFYRPRVRTAGTDFVVVSTSEARYAMTRALEASLSLLVNHDNQAPRRGARVATDGTVLFGLGARW
ncbi:DUF481 domain-containing protein [Roseisolibacter sp. H3M3-2]|uniref:DUF481 domain-containing protein n=1 Tax=Roseisolibacter sp. H3M3-2 TaxID=3031323 RepID=UPI0023DB0FDF|nr:DUF481 domain-containing protein [Roseisolibacter sp. H3M3-2]MDF1503972.1 DUF481 domain-containing protein [Roseisolibacter sp. H3M3-2]